MTDTNTATPVAVDTVKAAIHAAIADPSDLSAYAAMTDRGERSRVRSAIETRRDATMKSADMSDPDAVTKAGIEWHRLNGVLESIKSTRATVTKSADPIAIVAARIVALRTAADLIASGIVAVDGYDPMDFSDVDPSDFIASDVTMSAVRIASEKPGVGIARKAPTNDVAALVVAAMTDVPVGGYMSTNDIIKSIGDGHPSSGAINARLFAPNGCTIPGIDGVRGGTRPDAKVDGATRTA